MQRVVAEEEKGVKIHFDVSFLNTFQFAHTTIIVHIMCLCVLIEVGQLLVCFKKGSKAAKVAFIRNPEVGWQKKFLWFTWKQF